MNGNSTSELASSARLKFRRWTNEDAQFVLEMYGIKEVYQFLGSDPKPLTEMTKAQAAIVRWNERTFGVQGFWAVEPTVGPLANSVVGAVLLLPLPRSDELPTNDFEIGWHFHPKAWGNGFATEAARAVIERARIFQISEVHAVVYPTNTKSLAVCDRLQMTRLGETERWYKTLLVDHVLNLRD